MRVVALPLLLTVCACEAAPETSAGELRGVVLDARDDEPVAGATVRVEPGGVEADSDDDGAFALTLEAGVYQATASWPRRRTSDPVEVVVHRGEVTEVTLRVPDAPAELEVRVPVGILAAGYGELVTIEAVGRDPEGDPLTYEWRQTRGPDVTSTFRGQGTSTLQFRTRAVDDMLARDGRFGPLGISAAGQGEYTIEVTVSDGAHVASGQTRVRSGTAQANWPRLSLGVDGYFDCGDVERPDFMIDSVSPCRNRPGEDCTPPEIVGQVLDGDGIPHAETCTPRLRAHFEGAFYLTERTTGRRVLYEVGRWFGLNDGVSACARRDCHAAQTDAWKTTLHATVFQRGIDGLLREDYEPACAKCHTLGNDATARNNGFDDRSVQVGWDWPETLQPGNYDTIPPDLQDLANVQCSACHGPALFWTGLSVRVCAQCHDAPPSYRKVAEWRASRMSQFVRGLAEDDPALQPACTRCHSAQGFIDALRAERSHSREARPDEHLDLATLPHADKATPPTADVAEPITCAACHDPHTTFPRMMRVFGEERIPSRAEPINAASSAICLRCHNGQVDPRDPAAVAARRAPAFGAQADLYYATGAMSREPPPLLQHAGLINCIDCHKRTPTDPELLGAAGDHTFLIQTAGGQVNRAACADCHEAADGLDVPSSGDWDGNGAVEAARAEVRGLLGLVRLALDAAIVASDTTDCGGAAVAATFVERDGRVVLADAAGRALLDCAGEPVTFTDDALPLYRAAYDLLLVERDRSEGLHEPRFTAAVLQAALTGVVGDAVPLWDAAL